MKMKWSAKVLFHKATGNKNERNELYENYIRKIGCDRVFCLFVWQISKGVKNMVGWSFW